MGLAEPATVVALLHEGRTVRTVVDLTGWPRRQIIGLAGKHKLIHDPERDVCTAPKGAPPPEPTVPRLCAHERLIAWAVGSGDERAQALADQANAVLVKLRELKRKADEQGRPVDSKVVRAWAREQGIPCPPVGKVPAAVVQQWRAAQAVAG